MMKKIIFTAFGFFFLSFWGANIQAQNFAECIMGEVGNEACTQELDQVGPSIELEKGEDGRESLKATIRKFVNYFLGFLGLISVIVLIWAGVVYIFSLGDDGRVSMAKNIIMWTVIGIVVIAFSYTIVNTLFSEFAPGSVAQ